MTEEEAKTKTCHKTLAPVASADGSAPWHSPANCIGSGCMAWRWHNPRISNGELLWEKDTQGYCGLAGKP